MADVANRHPIDDGAAEPAQATVRVRPCEGCGGLPHGPVTETIDCLRAALARERGVTAPLRRALAAAQAEARELRWEMTHRVESASGPVTLEQWRREDEQAFADVKKKRKGSR